MPKYPIYMEEFWPVYVIIDDQKNPEVTVEIPDLLYRQYKNSMRTMEEIQKKLAKLYDEQR